MTLVLSLITPECLVQASDSRLVNPHTLEAVEDEENKAVVFCNSVVFGYTGLARLDGRATDIWLAETLSRTAGIQQGIDRLRDAATELWTRDFRRYPQPHAFCGSGWARRTEGGPLVAFSCRVANYVPGSTVDNNFKIGFRWWEQAVALVAEGQQVPNAQMNGLFRSIRRALNRKVSPLPFARLLGSAIVDAARSNKTVGRNVMMCLLPRSAAESGGSTLTLPVTGKGIDVGRVNGFRFGIDTGGNWVLHGPTFVCGGTIFAMPSVQGGYGSFATEAELKKMQLRVGGT